jgi:hypothetical protein
MEGLEGKKPAARPVARPAARPQGQGQRTVLVPVVKASTPKEKFERKAHQLPAGVLQRLKAKQLRVGDDIIYAVKYAGGQQTVNMFKSGDKKNIAETNIAFGKMPSNKYFVASGLVVLAGTADDSGDDAALGAKVDFQVVPAEIANAEFEFKIGQKIYFEEVSLEIFKHKRTDLQPGFYEFSEPIVILSDEDIRLDIKLAIPAPDKTWVKVMLIGAITGKN